MKPTRRKPYPAALASRKMLEAQGWVVDKVEQSMSFRKGGKTISFKRDLFGYADLIAMREQHPSIMLIQVTGGPDSSNFHARVRKLRAEPNHQVWLKAGGRIQVHGWESSEPPGEQSCGFCVFNEDDGGLVKLCKACAATTYKGRWCRVLEVTKE